MLGLLLALTLPGTQPLTAQGDLAARMVEGIDAYLMRATAASVRRRKDRWRVDRSSPEAHARSVAPNRERLAKILGVVDPRAPFAELEHVGGTGTPSKVATTEAFEAYAVRWPVLEGVDAEGLLLEPRGKVVGSAVALGDADSTPEMLVGLAPGLPAEQQIARRLAESGWRVLVPTLIDRQDTWSGNPKLGRMTNQPHREFVYRMAFEMGRHILGYEIQKVLAAVDWLRSRGGETVMVTGRGEGGLVAFYGGALDPRIGTTVVAGAFGPREGLWQEPIYRNVWGLLTEFGDAEVAQLFGPGRTLIVDPLGWPRVEGPPPVRPGRRGAAPGRLEMPPVSLLNAEYERIAALGGRARRQLDLRLSPPGPLPVDARPGFDPALRQKRQLEQLVAHVQKLLRDSAAQRQRSFWAKLDTSSPEAHRKSTQAFRDQLWEQVIGKLPPPTERPNPRARQVLDEPRWRGYEVTLDLYPGVFAYGILLVPKDLAPGERRPVVVCQHGLEGRPQEVVNPRQRSKHYNSFGAQLADRGYVVYAPQNPYIGQDGFRVLQRKANPLGLSLFSFIVRQHERTLEWLAALPFADPERIALYGLSYGGKTAMRVPALLPRYVLSICSGDFNEWVAKNVSVDFPGSYMFLHEYEMPEFDLGHTFDYAEMAALIAPRPFMVERGHDDGVGIDEWVAAEYAKVRRLYARLRIPERTAIEFFPGGHEVNGQGTFEFLDRYLRLRM